MTRCDMDRTLLVSELAELELAREQVADLEMRVDRQRALLCELEESDQSTETATALLEVMEDALEGFEHHARLIEQEISQSMERSARVPAETV